MGMHLIGACAIIPVSVLLTVSFFVLVVLRKIDKQALKTIGYVVAVSLWVSALLISLGGLRTLVTGKPTMTSPMFEMMRGQKCPMMGAKLREMTPEKMEKMKHEMMEQEE